MVRILDEIEIFGVYDRGVPNEERIALRVKRQINLRDYLMILGVPISEQLAFPLEGNLYHFSSELVDSPAWIFFYTGTGERRITREVQTGEPAIVIHWGKQYTILNDERVVPVILGIDGVLVGGTKSLLLFPPKEIESK
jgi:hypothetical protein